jgi:LuxR family maltose regulon positive regulatory protein
MKQSSSKAPFLTKIISPRISNPVLRPRLFQRLDQLRNSPIIWIVSPPGAGKTTLASTYLSEKSLDYLWYQIDSGDADVASFFLHLKQAIQQAEPLYRQTLPLLTPEYVPGLTAFVRLYAEAIAERIKRPALIVLDNYEQVSSETSLHDIIRELAGSLPPEIGLMVLSRAEPPPAFARLRLHGELSILSAGELNLTTDEAQVFAKAKQQQNAIPLDAEQISRVFRQSQGWIAGFMFLLTNKYENDGNSQELGENQQLIFDYFTAELFGHFSQAVQRGLVCSALLPVMTSPTIEQLTGNPEIAIVLANLQRRNCFVVQRGQTEPVYEYHGLFRAFLLDQIRALFEPAELQQLQKRAGDLLSETGQSDSAARLYCEAKAWDALASLAMREAPSLLAAGRHGTLDQWINAIPSTAGENPWLLFWQGMARSPFRPVEARDLFERAYSLFEEQDDAAGLYSSWSGIMETYLNEFDDFRPVDHWIEEFKQLRMRHPDYPSADVELRTACAIMPIMLRRPGETMVRHWLERAPDLLDPVHHLEQSILLGSYIISYAEWQGDRYKIRQIVERLDAYTHAQTLSPLNYILCRVMGRGVLHIIFGETEAYRICAEEALDMAKRTGLHLWDFLLYSGLVYCLLINGNTAEAEAVMDTASDSWPKHCSIHNALYHHLRSNIAGQHGDWPEAAEQAHTAVKMAIKSGAPFPEAWCRMDLARTLFRLGDSKKAREHLNQAWTIARAMTSKTLVNFCLVTEAAAAFQENNEEFGMARLAEALALSRAMGGPLFELSGPSYMAPLYNRALEAGIEVDHVQSMIRRYRFLPPDPATASDLWPWPVRIYTLGRFDILCDDHSLRSSRKAQNKPLELVKLLCALGGSSIHQNCVTDMLWPDAMGDAAEQALGTTLHRLRNLLKYEQAIRLEDRRLSLNPQIVWVDALAFDRIAHQPNRTDQNSLQCALNRYRGHFLEGDSAAWALAFRERLRSHFLKMSKRLGALLEQEEDWPAAIDCYHRVIEVEPVAESFYRRLMICHGKIGQRAEALTVFQRCRQALLTHLGVSPTRELRELYQKLIDS